MKVIILNSNPEANVNELLRICGPARYVIRHCLRETNVDGQVFKKGDSLLLMLAKGNLDSERYPDPNRLNFYRPAKAHLSFGKGPHACLGAPLIRMAAAILPIEIIKKYPNARIDPKSVHFGGTAAIAGVDSLVLC